MDIRQPLLLLLSVTGLVLLFRHKRLDLIAGWVAITLSVHVFDIFALTNLPSGRLVGLLYLPQALLRLPYWIRFRPVAAWSFNFGYLVLLGIVFGYIIPWPELVGNHSWPTTAPGRAVIYPARLVLDLSLMIFLAEQFRKPGVLLLFGRMFILGAVLTAGVGFVSFLIPGLDPFSLMTGQPDLSYIGFERARGLSYEPRGLGLSCVYGVMILLIYPSVFSLRRRAALVILLAGLFVTFSTSAILVGLAGLPVIWSHLSRRVQRAVLGAVVSIPVLLLILSAAVPSQIQKGVSILQDHTGSDRLHGAVAQNLVQAIAWRLDVFDASGLLFLGTHPYYILSGTGPGEITVAASQSLPPGVFTLIYGNAGLNGVPNLGLLLEICNSGLIGLSVWSLQIFYSRRALLRLSALDVPDSDRDEWKFGWGFFLIGATFYVLQNPLEQPFWPVSLAIGWAAVSTAASRNQANPTPAPLVTATAATGL